MKAIFLILFTFAIFNLQAQKLPYSKKDAVIGASILGATFIVMEAKGDQMTYLGRSITAMSGIAISAGYTLFKTSKASKKIHRRIKLNRNKKQNENKHDFILCDCRFSNP